MTAQEQQMLQGLIERINQTQLPEKDTDAEAMLQNTLGRNPDALYILAQTVLVQQYALEQAQKQIADLRAQADQLRQAPAPAKHTSFLGSLLGRDDDPPRQPPPPPPMQPQYAPVPSYPPAYGQPMQYGQPMPYGQPVAYGAPQGGGFLRSAAQTAAGVAAGALAFEGIESLMHGFGHAAGYGPGIGSGFGGASFGEGAPREEVINNYYGDATPGGEHEHHGLDDRDTSGSFLGNANDRGGDAAHLSDAAYTGGNNEQDLTGSDWNTGSGSDSVDDGSQADQAADSSGFDDSSSDFDSGGGIDSSSDFDSGGGDSF